MIPEDFGQITHEFTGTQLPNGAAVVYGIANPLSINVDAVASLALTAFSLIMPQLSAGITLVNTRAKLGPDETGPSFEEGSSVAGGVASANGLTPNAAYLCTKGTAVGGRRGKGRMYIPGCSETVVDPNGQLTGAFRITLQGLVDDFMASLLTNDIPMALLHGPATEWTLVDGQPRRVPVAGPIPDPDPVLSLTVAASVGTQRRRLR